MQIEVSFFAGLRERLQSDGEQLVLPEGVITVNALRDYLAERGGVWADNFGCEQQVLAAINETMASADAALKAGDKVAFFPPVSGG